jgi:hypothetical protein
MISIKNYEVPNQLSELTISQFDKLSHIEKDNELDNIEKWISKFVYLGVPEEAFDEMTFDELKEHILSWNEVSVANAPKVLSIEVDGYTYEAKETIGAKDLGLIEKAWKANNESFASELTAILFKRTDLSRTEHYAPAHIKQKTKLFSTLKIEVAFPFVVEVIKQLTVQVQKLNDSPAVVESDNSQSVS